MCKARPSLPTATDSPSSLVNPEPPEIQTEGTQTDNPLFNIDDTINRLYQEVSTHQQRLDSIEQSRLEMVNFNRLLSFLPKPTLPKEEDGFTHQDTVDSYDGSWGDNRIQYPAV